MALRPELALASLAAVFVFSGPAAKLAGLFRRKGTAAAEPGTRP